MTTNDQQKELIYHFARFCWKHKDELAPNLEENEKGRKERVSWGEVFKRRTGESLESYADRHRSGGGE